MLAKIKKFFSDRQDVLTLQKELSDAKHVIYQQSLEVCKALQQRDEFQRLTEELTRISKENSENFNRCAVTATQLRLTEMALDACSYRRRQFVQDINIIKDALANLVLHSRKIRHDFECGNWPKDERFHAFEEAIREASKHEQKLFYKEHS